MVRPTRFERVTFAFGSDSLRGEGTRKPLPSGSRGAPPATKEGVLQWVMRCSGRPPRPRKPGSAEHGDGAIVRGRHGSNSSAQIGAVSTVQFRSRERHAGSPQSMTRATSCRLGRSLPLTDRTDPTPCGIPANYEPMQEIATPRLDVVADVTPDGAAIQADGDEGYTCSIARITAFSSLQKSRSSYPYKL